MATQVEEAPDNDACYERACEAHEKAKITYQKVVDGARHLIKTGSGKVPILLPVDYVQPVEPR